MVDDPRPLGDPAVIAELMIRDYEQALKIYPRDWTDLKRAIAAALAAAEQGRQEAEQELRGVDAVLARRPALDLPTRRENIEKAISFAARTDEAERCLQAATRRAEAAEARVRELEQARPQEER